MSWTNSIQLIQCYCIHLQPFTEENNHFFWWGTFWSHPWSHLPPLTCQHIFAWRLLPSVPGLFGVTISVFILYFCSLAERCLDINCRSSNCLNSSVMTKNSGDWVGFPQGQCLSSCLVNSELFNPHWLLWLLTDSRMGKHSVCGVGFVWVEVMC